jgi:DegV family protein with EDD domain
VVETGKKMRTFAVVPSLKYLALSGRVSKFVSGLANTLNIKPILSVRDGKLDLLEKVRTQKKAIDRMLALIAKAAKGKKIERAAIIHVNNLPGAEELEGLLREYLHCPENIIITAFTPGLSVHTGSGVVGVVIQTD